MTEHEKVLEYLTHLSNDKFTATVNEALDRRHEEAKRKFTPYQRIERLEVYLDKVGDTAGTCTALKHTFQRREGWDTLPKVYEKLKGVRGGSPLQLPLHLYVDDHRLYNGQLSSLQEEAAWNWEVELFHALDAAGAKYYFKPIVDRWVTEPDYFNPFMPVGAIPSVFPAIRDENDVAGDV